jgi:hypothetical protein
MHPFQQNYKPNTCLGRDYWPVPNVGRLGSRQNLLRGAGLEFVPLANTEAVEMMRVAQPWQTGPVDIGMALGYGRGALVITENRTALQLENIAFVIRS